MMDIAASRLSSAQATSRTRLPLLWIVLSLAVLGAATLVMLGVMAGRVLAPRGRGQVAFISGNNGVPDLFLMDSSRGLALQLTNDPLFESNPVWSPDGGRIAFVVHSGFASELVVMRSDGRDRRVAATVNPGANIAWSPDSRSLVFTSNQEGNDDIFVVDADGSNFQALTEHPAADSNPVWSPDGKRLAFTSFRAGNTEIYSLDVASGALQNLTENPAEDRKPIWSPDGRQIAFVSNRGESTEFYVMDADGQNVARLSGNNAALGGDLLGADLMWSPDGTRIVYIDDLRGALRDRPQLFIVEADGSGRRRLAAFDMRSGALLGQHLAWAGGEDQLAFIAFPDVGPPELYLLDIENGDKRRLTTRQGIADIAWKP